jgi:hypothetical protein
VEPKNQAKKLGQLPTEWGEAAKASRFGKLEDSTSRRLVGGFEEIEKSYNKSTTLSLPNLRNTDETLSVDQPFTGLTASRVAGGATIWLKREDLALTGAQD